MILTKMEYSSSAMGFRLELPDSLTSIEVRRALEIMGLTEHYTMGGFSVFLNPGPGNPILFQMDAWDNSREDIEYNLSKNNLDVEQFWTCYRSIYSTTE